MTKKILSLALAAVMALGLMACGSQSSGSAGGNASGGASASQSGAPYPFSKLKSQNQLPQIKWNTASPQQQCCKYTSFHDFDIA